MNSLNQTRPISMCHSKHHPPTTAIPLTSPPSELTPHARSPLRPSTHRAHSSCPLNKLYTRSASFPPAHRHQGPPLSTPTHTHTSQLSDAAHASLSTSRLSHAKYPPALLGARHLMRFAWLDKNRVHVSALYTFFFRTCAINLYLTFNTEGWNCNCLHLFFFLIFALLEEEGLDTLLF